MRTIHQGHLPVRTLVLIGMVILITAQAYAQNANARLTITLRNATLKEFVKLIENSTGYSFIYSEEISISHKIREFRESLYICYIVANQNYRLFIEINHIITKHLPVTYAAQAFKLGTYKFYKFNITCHIAILICKLI